MNSRHLVALLIIHLAFVVMLPCFWLKLWYSVCLEHPWIKGGQASDKPIDGAVLLRMKQFRAMNKLKKLALKVNYQIVLRRSYCQIIKIVLSCPWILYNGCQLLLERWLECLIWWFSYTKYMKLPQLNNLTVQEMKPSKY